MPSEVLEFARCARVSLWLQKSASAVGLREAIMVAAKMGDGGLAFHYEGKPWEGERASRVSPSGNGCRNEGSVEGHLLVKGVLGRGSQESSRIVGGMDLGYRVRQHSRIAVLGRQRH